jgi:hypothetical protein
MVDGESHYYLGQRYRMRVVEQSGATTISIPDKNTMVLTCSAGTSLATKRNALESWYRARLSDVVPPLLDEWLDKFELTAITWRVRRMKTKWATVDISKRIITLNPELAKQNYESLTAVIVHELSHFFEKSHGEAFIAVMDAQLPDWRSRTSRLNQALLSVEDWKE